MASSAAKRWDDPEASNRAASPIDGTAPVRVAELDALRGMAALAVVVFHANGFWIPWGWTSVDLFFVLSGYLITAIILRHAGSPGFLPRFYARRGLRIWPLYFLMVGLVAAASPLLTHRPDWSGFGAILTFTQGVSEYWTGRPAPLFSPYLAHTWTLAIEEQFYLIWPALVLLVGRARVIPLALTVVLVSVSARWSGWSYILLLARADGLAMGALLAALAVRAGNDPGKRKDLAGLSLAAALFGFAAVRLLGGFTFMQRMVRPGPVLLAYNLLYVGVVGMVVVGSGRVDLAWLRRWWLIWLGTVSYGLYLIHHVVFVIVSDFLQAHHVAGRPAWVFIPAIAASLLLAGLSYRWFEYPILGLRSRFEYAVFRPSPLPGSTRRSHRTVERPPHLRVSAVDFNPTADHSGERP